MLFGIIMLVGAFFLIVELGIKSENKKAETEASQMPEVHVKVVNTRKKGANGYVTFEKDNGERVELLARAELATIGTYVVGDTGNLRYGNNQVVSWVRDHQ